MSAKITGLLSNGILAHVNPATGSGSDHLWVHALEAGLILGASAFIIYAVIRFRKKYRT